MEKINGIIVNGRVYEIRALDILPLLKSWVSLSRIS